MAAGFIHFLLMTTNGASIKFLYQQFQRFATQEFNETHTTDCARQFLKIQGNSKLWRHRDLLKLYRSLACCVRCSCTAMQTSVCKPNKSAPRSRKSHYYMGWLATSLHCHVNTTNEKNSQRCVCAGALHPAAGVPPFIRKDY